MKKSIFVFCTEEKMKIKKLIIMAFALLLTICMVSCGDQTEKEGVITGDLEFVSNGDGTCYVAGIGGYAAANTIEVPAKSPKGDTVTGIGDWAFGMISTELIAPIMMEASSFEEQILTPLKAADSWSANKTMIYYNKQTVDGRDVYVFNGKEGERSTISGYIKEYVPSFTKENLVAAYKTVYGGGCRVDDVLKTV